MFDSVDWNSVFTADTPLLEIFVRGTLMYLGIFLMLRFILNRQKGSISVTDILLIVLLSDAAQNGMADDYKTVTDGLLLVATIIFWDFLLDWLGYHVPAFARFIDPEAVPLIRHGKFLRKHMREEMITEEELMGHLRQKGVDDVKHVKKAMMESGGEVSVVTYGRRPGAAARSRRASP